MDRPRFRRSLPVVTLVVALMLAGAHSSRLGAQAGGGEFSDSHFHLTNYIQRGITARQFLQIMGTRVGRSTLFGIPLQQQWSYANSGDFAPTCYLHSDAPLYYYSFTDAFIASEYRKLSKDEQQRFDPMITGFNPADMYGVDHMRRVLETFPGVCTGIGEFSIHKECVSAKVSGETASLTNPALDRILDFAAETGLVALIHNDVDMPFTHIGIVEQMVSDPELRHVSFDISWDEVAKYAVASPEATARVTAMLNRHPDRFLFGADTVAPAGPAPYYAVYDLWAPVWKGLTADASLKVRKGNYERIFDQARQRVRAWERTHVN